MNNNLIERMVGMLQKGEVLEITNGSLPDARQTVIHLKNEDKKGGFVSRKLWATIKWPHTDKDAYLTFIDLLAILRKS